MIYSVITGTGSCIPDHIQTNEAFLNHEFFENNGRIIDKSSAEIIEKFSDITTIQSRRYAGEGVYASDLATEAGKKALNDSGIDPEALDYIIVAHNFGDVRSNSSRVDTVPSLAARVKHNLGIKNPAAVAYDIVFGCPGWIQAVIQANYFIRSGDATHILVIGTDTLSKISDPHDRDSMIYADGAGAVVLEAKESDAPIGIISHSMRSDTFLYSKMLFMGPSNNPDFPDQEKLFIKMNGRRLYQYALDTVPKAIQQCLEKASLHVSDIDKILIHQANGKMDDAILERLYSLYGLQPDSQKVMPMTISELGNSSVATVPTLLDLIRKGKMNGHYIQSNDLLVFASVGAGMSINALVYKVY